MNAAVRVGELNYYRIMLSAAQHDELSGASDRSVIEGDCYRLAFRRGRGCAPINCLEIL